MNKTLNSIYILLLLFCSSVKGNVTLPAVIAENMVLQQNSKVTLWGWADAGESITVHNSWENKTVKTQANSQGNWQIEMKTSKAGGPYLVVIKGKNTITLKNVLLGEVWLCSGQSNMEYPLGKQEGWRKGVGNYEKEVAEANYPNIRLFTVKQKVAEEPQKDVIGSWNSCTPETAAGFSAVAYYFAREITKVTGVPVGLIHSSWGGTPAESWVKKEVLESDPDLKPILDNYLKNVKEYPSVLKSYEEQMAKWKKESPESEQNGSKLKSAPRKPVDPIGDSKSPTKLYNAMISPLVPYTLKGVIWYQGESNSDRPYQYRKLFASLIRSWRKDWKTEFPFYFVQIAAHYDKNPEIREAQLLTYKAVENTGMVVLTDAGDSLNIHPTNKEIVGKRLSFWALNKLYGQKGLVPSGPVYKSMKAETGKIRLEFDYADGGLITKDGALREFTIAGADQKFVPAVAVIENNSIVVWNSSVKNPVAVRFAWKNFMHPNLYNKAGLPASPFRTDNWSDKSLDKTYN